MKCMLEAGEDGMLTRRLRGCAKPGVGVEMGQLG